jgi:hypothetical protein
MKKFKYVITQNQTKPIFYTVSFFTDGGTEVANRFVAANSKISQPQTTKDGFILLGWTRSYEQIEPWSFETDIVTEDITLYAIWQIDESLLNYIYVGGGSGYLAKHRTLDFLLIDAASDLSSRTYIIKKDSEHLYAITNNRRISKYTLSTSPNEIELNNLVQQITTPPGTIFGMDIDDTHIYVAGDNFENNNRIFKYLKSDLTLVGQSDRFQISGNNYSFGRLTLDDDYIYTTETVGNHFRIYNKNDLSLKFSFFAGLVQSQIPPDIIVDSTHIYTIGPNSCVIKYNKSDMTVAAIDPTGYAYSTLAVDDTYVYAGARFTTTNSNVIKLLKSDLSNIQFSPRTNLRTLWSLVIDNEYIYTGGEGRFSQENTITKYRKDDLSISLRTENLGFQVYSLLFKSNEIANQTLFTTPGTYTWVAPEGVTSVSVALIGGGDSGTASRNTLDDDGFSSYMSSSGVGSGLAWKNNISVVPGQSYTVVVGAGGAQPIATGTEFSTATNKGGRSYFISDSFLSAGTGSFSVPQLRGQSGGFLGGNSGQVQWTQQYGFVSVPGGGGAGGFFGNGAEGEGFSPINNDRANNGPSTFDGAGGGGSSGIQLQSNTTTPLTLFSGFGGGTSLTNISSSYTGSQGTSSSSGAFGTNGLGTGLYGGGGWSSLTINSPGSQNTAGPGKGGAVRIVWNGQTFPNNA